MEIISAEDLKLPQHPKFEKMGKNSERWVEILVDANQVREKK
jgi:hypothetical protein